MIRSRRLFASLALSLAVVAGCGKDSSDVAPKPAATQNLSAVPAPAGLVSELLVPKPGALWAKTRALVGSKMRLAPASLPAAMSLFMGIPALAAEQIDADAPMTGALVQQGDLDLPVLTLKLKDPGRFLAVMSGTPDSKLAAKVDEATRITELTPRAGQTALGPSMGVLGDRLLIGYAPDAVLKVGPYAARTLPTRPMPEDDAVALAPHDALAGPLRDRVKKFWADTKKQLEESAAAQRKEKGEPELANPDAVVAQMDQQFQSLGVLLSDLAEARAIVRIDEWGLHVRTLAKPLSKDGPASAELAALAVGDLGPLYDMPADTTFAALFRESEDLRKKNMVQQVQNVDRLFSGKLTDKERNTVRDLFDQWTKGRGDWLTIGGKVAPQGAVLFGQVSLNDEAVLDKALRGVLEVPKIPAFNALIQSNFGNVKVSAPSALGEPKGSVVKIERSPRDDKAKDDKAKDDKAKDAKKDKADKDPGKKDRDRKDGKSSTELGWWFEKAAMSFVLGNSAKDLAGEVVKGKEAGLRADAEVKRVLDPVDKEKDASVAVLVLATRLLAGAMPRDPRKPMPQPEASPVLLTLGRTKDDGYLRIDAAQKAVEMVMGIQGL